MLGRRPHRYRDEVATRARQQAVVADLGQRALAGLPLDDLIDEAVAGAARELGTDYVSVLDTIQDPNAIDPEAEAHTSELKDRLADAIESLPDRERLVVALYYYENLTLREIGEVLGVTESRVSQLHTKSVLALRSRFQSNPAS